MKKVFLLIMALGLVLVVSCLPFAASAEEVRFTYAIDWTGLVVWIVGLASSFLSALAAYVWKKHLQPWIVQMNLMQAAEVVVNAVEAIIGRYNGLEKWAMALEKMQERGFNIDSAVVTDALDAAWEKLNLQQIAAGVKDGLPVSE